MALLPQKSPPDLYNDMKKITGPLEKMLQNLANNPQGTPAGKEQAQQVLVALQKFHREAEKIVSSSEQANISSNRSSISFT
jgi:hypothetical protein